MKKLSSKAQGLMAINSAAVIFGSAALFGKLDLSPFWIVGMRAAFAALALLIIGLWKGGISFPSRSHWSVIGLTGILLAVHWLTFFASVQMSGVAVATLTFATFPFFTVLIEAIHFKRRPYSRQIGASFVIIFAVSLLVQPEDHAANISGIEAGIASAVTFAFFGQASKKLGQTLPPLSLSFIQNGIVALLILPVLVVLGHSPRQASDWLWLALLGIVTTAFMHQLYFYALKRLSAGTCGAFIALEPVYAILFAALLFHEPMTIIVILSAVLIISASLVFLTYEPPS